MDIRLESLRIENFKGIKEFELTLQGKNALIRAENGVGKTTIYDAFLWLLFGKNSEGRSDFEVRPLGGNNQPVKGLVVCVEAELTVGGVSSVFKKEEHEKVVKDQLRGYETLCWVNGVPKKVGEYSAYINEIIKEDTFKLLTDLTHFNTKLHWTKRREVLLDIAGEIGTPEGFDELVSKLNGRSVEEYKKVLLAEKKRHEKERSEINPRIDEIHRGLSQVETNVDEKELCKQRGEIKAEIETLEKRHKEVLDGEKERQKKLELINALKGKRMQRENELRNDTSSIQPHLDEKKKLIQRETDLEVEGNQLLTQKTTAESELESIIEKLNSATESLSGIRDKFTAAKEKKTDETCYACGQKLPENKLKEVEEKRKEELETLTKLGDEAKAKVKELKQKKANMEEKVKTLRGEYEKKEEELKNYRQGVARRLKEIDELLQAGKHVAFDTDKTWLTFSAEIDRLEKEVGESAAEQLQKIEEEKNKKLNAVETLNKTLAQMDRIEQDKKRIKELEDKEATLAQVIADVEKELHSIDEYKATESRMIENSVNGKFRHVIFKLFEELLNKELRECCEATLNGVPYTDLSTGQQIIVGVDIVNVLSEHYDVSVPMFIDHTESMTLPIEAQTQTIKLFAENNVGDLVVEYC